MSASDGYIVGTSKIVDNGPDSSRWNLVIIGDGYRDSELTQYHTDVDNFLTKLRTTPPFDELFCGINVHRIDVVSTDSGADDPPDCAGGTGAAPRTYFDATFCSVGPGGVRLDRLLTWIQAWHCRWLRRKCRSGIRCYVLSTRASTAALAASLPRAQQTPRRRILPFMRWATAPSGWQTNMAAMA